MPAERYDLTAALKLAWHHGPRKCGSTFCPVCGRPPPILDDVERGLAMTLTGTIGNVAFHGPDWLTATLAAGVGVTLATLLASFIYFILKNPDILRKDEL